MFGEQDAAPQPAEQKIVAGEQPEPERMRKDAHHALKHGIPDVHRKGERGENHRARAVIVQNAAQCGALFRRTSKHHFDARDEPDEQIDGVREEHRRARIDDICPYPVVPEHDHRHRARDKQQRQRADRDQKGLPGFPEDLPQPAPAH